MTWLNRSATVLLAAVLLVFAQTSLAEPVKLRLGTLIPKNSLYHRALLEMGEAWKRAQNDGSTFTAYTDGTQGSETDTVKRMRIGQLNAALITVVGLREIDPAVSALQNLPLAFRSWEELDYVRDKMRPALDKKFLDKGYVVLLWGDGGWVRFFSHDPASRPEDYKHMKMFSWAGEPEQLEIMKRLGYQPVSLETADILPALQTGLINAVPATPYFALAAQLNGPAPYMLELNWAPIVGALVITAKVWNAMSPAGREALRREAVTTGAQMRLKARAEVDEAVAAMQKRGLRVTKLSPADEAEWRKFAEGVYPKIQGTLVPSETFDEVTRLLREYRARGSK